jgi:hypothetical protein
MLTQDGGRIDLGSVQVPASGNWTISVPDIRGKGPVLRP